MYDYEHVIVSTHLDKVLDTPENGLNTHALTLMNKE
jgi:hypothetical protein